MLNLEGSCDRVYMVLVASPRSFVDKSIWKKGLSIIVHHELHSAADNAQYIRSTYGELHRLPL
jgi:hypothetical protein